MLDESIPAGYDEFVAMVLAKMRQKERAPATIAETERVLDLFKMICDPGDVARINVNMLDRFDAERAKGVKRCHRRACR